MEYQRERNHPASEKDAEYLGFDGPVGWVIQLVRKHWRWLLTALLIPLLNVGYEYYLYRMDFPVTPEIITEEEFHLLVEYADVIDAELDDPMVKTEVKTGGRTLRTYTMFDTDGDGMGDIYIGLDKHGPLKSYGWRTETDAEGNRKAVYFENPWEPTALEVSSGIYRVHWLDVLLGKAEGFGVCAEDIFLYDHTGSLHMIVNDPQGNDHTELREQIERMLQIAKAARAAEQE